MKIKRYESIFKTENKLTEGILSGFRHKSVYKAIGKEFRVYKINAKEINLEFIDSPSIVIKLDNPQKAEYQGGMGMLGGTNKTEAVDMSVSNDGGNSFRHYGTIPHSNLDISLRNVVVDLI